MTVRIHEGSNADLQNKLAKLEAFRAMIANMAPIRFEDGSWTDDQAEDAIATVNQLIDRARKLKPLGSPANARQTHNTAL